MKLFGFLVLFIGVYHTICVSAFLRSFPSSENVQRVKRQANPNSIPLQSDRKMTYFGNISIANPPQYFKILFDTAAGGFWVLSDRCQWPGCHSTTHSMYRHEISTTSKIIQHPSPNNEVYIRDEWVSGSWIMDTLKVGSVTMVDLLFLEARLVSDNFQKETFDGVMGFGYDPSKDDNIITKLCKDSTEKKVSFYFARKKAPVERGSGGQVTFCGEDRNKFEGTPLYTKVDDGWFWRIKLEKIIWFGGGNSYVRERLVDKKALFNTAEPFIAGPEEFVQAIYADTESKYDNATGRQIVECGKINTFSGLTFTISNIDYPMWAEDYILEPLDPNDKKNCVLGIKVQPKNNVAEWVLGTIFIRKFYAIFDAKNAQIGLAKSIHA